MAGGSGKTMLSLALMGCFRWALVETRRFMDLEYRLHQLGRLWLYVHGPAAWALFVLMIEHVVMSWWYGGF